jgi:hypothetical protein
VTDTVKAFLLFQNVPPQGKTASSQSRFVGLALLAGLCILIKLFVDADVGVRVVMVEKVMMVADRAMRP